MGSSTSPDSLYKPTVGEEGWGNAVNANMDTIQTRLAGHDDDIAGLQPEAVEDTFQVAGRTIAANAGVYRYNSGAGSAAADLNTQDWYWVDWLAATQLNSVRSGPQWFQTDTFDGTLGGNWDVVFPSGTWMYLPRGRYYWTAQMKTSIAPSLTQFYWIYLDFIETMGSDSWSQVDQSGFGRTQGSLTSGIQQQFLKGAGWMEVVEEDRAVFPYLELGSGAEVAGTLTQADFYINKLA